VKAREESWHQFNAILVTRLKHPKIPVYLNQVTKQWG